MEPAIPEKFSICDVCKSRLGNFKMGTPLYCISCIEEMERLNLSPRRYKKHRASG